MSTETQPEELGSQVFRSLRWMAAGRLMGQVISWAITLLIIRILSPDDYGLLSLSMIMIGLVDRLREVGLGDALIQRKELDDELLRRVFGFLVGMNLAFYVLLFFSAPLIADFFGEERVTLLMRVLALSFPIMAFSVIPLSLIARRMHFKQQAIVQFISMLVASVATLILALAGLGVWALVGGNLLQQVTLIVGINIAAKYDGRPVFRLGGLKDILTFGGLTTLKSVLWYTFHTADSFTIGKVLGKKILGFYTIAMHFATLPMSRIQGILNQVGLAAYSRIQSDRGLLAAHYYKVSRMVAFFAFPVFWGISCTAPEIVSVLLGTKWLNATVPLQILSLVVPLRMLAAVTDPAVTAIGRPGVWTINQAIGCIVMPTAFVIGAQWGLLGISVAWVTAYPVLFAIMLMRAFGPLGVTMRVYLKNIFGPAATGVAMYGAVALVRVTIAQPFLPPAAGLGLLVVVGVGVYGGISFLFRREACREMLRVIRG